MAKRARLEEAVEASLASLANSFLPEHHKSKYDPAFARQARFLAQRGAIQSDLAEFFQVSTRTIQNWMVNHSDFADAVSVGNDVFNTRVERSLAECALGFHATVQEWKKNEVGQLVLKEYQRYFPPNVTAQIFFLKNRIPEKWRDVTEHRVTTAPKTPEELSEDIRKDLLNLQSQGYLRGVEVFALTDKSSKKNGKGNGHS